jgi:hypothetical protein
MAESRRKIRFTYLDDISDGAFNDGIHTISAKHHRDTSPEFVAKICAGAGRLRRLYGVRDKPRSLCDEFRYSAEIISPCLDNQF